MGWTLRRWTWVLEGPLFVGFAPSGSLNRCRIYVPARTVWGAVTAEATRHATESKPDDYKRVGDELKSDARFSYLYPAERLGERWLAWLPSYSAGHGLCWRREDDRSGPVSDRVFRRRLLTTRPGTAIDPSSDSAADGSLRETECVNDRWRESQEGEEHRLAYVGYVFTRSKAAEKYAASVDRLFLGGDTRYGLGRVRREAFEPGESMFGANVTLDSDSPVVTTACVLAHALPAPAPDEPTKMHGALERLVGWERHERTQLGGAPAWQPGSWWAAPTPPSPDWTVEESGLWRTAP